MAEPVATTATAAEQRQALRELADWRAVLPVRRAELEREADALVLQRAELDRVTGEQQALGAQIVRRRQETYDRWDAGENQWHVLREEIGRLMVATNALQANVTLRRQRIAGLERQIRERAQALGVTLEPGEAGPPPDGPPPSVVSSATPPWLRTPGA
jgi:hypothetical protein